MVLFGTISLFMVAKSSLAKALAEIDWESDMMEELGSAYWRFILGSTPVNALSLPATLALELMARGKKGLQHLVILLDHVAIYDRRATHWVTL